MPSRRKARECALQMLFQWDVGRHEPRSVPEMFWSHSAPRDEESVRAFANQLFHGAIDHMEQINGLIASHAEHWRVERMPAVDRNILRLAVYELMHCRETPPLVVINESLEIARKFSSEESVQFINGVLDSIRKELEAQRVA